MEHSFNIFIAKKYGINCAIILKNLFYWCQKNKANNKHFYENTFWTYNSISAFSELFPYLSEKQIRLALEKLIDNALILKGNYNTSSYDRTSWYALTIKGESICTKGQIDYDERANEVAPEGEPIPYINTDSKPNKKPYIKKEEKEFSNPSLSIC